MNIDRILGRMEIEALLGVHNGSFSFQLSAIKLVSTLVNMYV